MPNEPLTRLKTLVIPGAEGASLRGALFAKPSAGAAVSCRKPEK